MKLSEVLASLIKSNIELDGKNDYRKVSQYAQGLGVKLSNQQVWKLINSLAGQGQEVEDDL